METIPLLDLMSQQVAEEKAALVAKAAAEAAQILRDAEARARQRHDESLAALSAELEAQSRRSRERVEAEAHMILLTTKDTITDEMLATVREQLHALASGPEFERVLEKLLAELLQDAPDNVVVLAPPAHAGFCRTWLDANGHGNLSVQPLEGLQGGAAIQDAGRSFRVTNTLETRFLKRESALRKFCLTGLFGGSEGAA
ncbi:MAG: hypothetical protein HYV27_21820 [Candidatus Hydrogenedentes bacterium]|nr:hypothetical protein [Candidatus Hydrogenedentota bacterium]